MTRQPALDDLMLMGGVIVQNNVDALAQRNFAVDVLEKFQPLAVGVFLGGVSDDFALQVIQRGKESDGAVAIVIVGLMRICPLPRGRPGWLRCSAWIWHFSSQQSTTACSGGLRYRPM